jgi:hypothetical protein
MSIKYYGYILKKTKLEDALSFIKGQYSAFNSIYSNCIKQKFVDYVYDSLDDALIHHNKAKEKSLYEIADNYQKIIFDSYKMENKVYKVAFCFFPHKRDVLVMNYSDSIYNELIKSFNWEDYSYWNNTDKPDNISSSAWKTRLFVWDSVLNNDTPANSSLMYQPSFCQINDYPFLWKYKDLKKYFDKKNANVRLQKYRKNYDFSVTYFNNKKPFDFENIKSDDMIEITELNFNNTFKVIEPKNFVI